MVDGRARKNRWNAETRQRNRTLLIDYLQTHPCIDCGETDIVVLEFDHVGGQKVANVSSLASKCYNVNKIVAEIDKCVVRCANCHRRKTAKTLGNYRLTYISLCNSIGRVALS